MFYLIFRDTVSSLNQIPTKESRPVQIVPWSGITIMLQCHVSFGDSAQIAKSRLDKVLDQVSYQLHIFPAVRLPCKLFRFLVPKADYSTDIYKTSSFSAPFQPVSTSSFEMITLYDFASTLPGRTLSPYVWKVRSVPLATLLCRECPLTSPRDAELLSTSKA